jgi:hypothetical protein
MGGLVGLAVPARPEGCGGEQRLTIARRRRFGLRSSDYVYAMAIERGRISLCNAFGPRGDREAYWGDQNPSLG